jgi:hypothetical protein
VMIERFLLCWLGELVYPSGRTGMGSESGHSCIKSW